jgi:regulator of replication initiation timing
MKRNYEDLQKEMDQLNSKMAKVKIEASEIRTRLDNEDFEKDNEIKQKVDDKICECDKDINGEKASERSLGTDERGKDKPVSLYVIKKDIIGSINKMVNQFNENNK